MSAPTKMHRTKTVKARTQTARSKEKNISWREAAEDNIAKYSEGGLMLKGSRHKKNITQKDLAETLGISQHHISEMENGKRSIGKDMARRLSEFFKTDYRIFL